MVAQQVMHGCHGCAAGSCTGEVIVQLGHARVRWSCSWFMHRSVGRRKIPSYLLMHLPASSPTDMFVSLCLDRDPFAPASAKQGSASQQLPVDGLGGGEVEGGSGGKQGVWQDLGAHDKLVAGGCYQQGTTLQASLRGVWACKQVDTHMCIKGGRGVEREERGAGRERDVWRWLPIGQQRHAGAVQATAATCQTFQGIMQTQHCKPGNSRGLSLGASSAAGSMQLLSTHHHKRQ
eukprot:1152171-Pelagomonas_calceolata.AAC.3